MRRSGRRSPPTEQLFAAERPARTDLPSAASAPLRALLASPSPYSVGMGGLSLQAVWESLQATGAFKCDRAFSEFPDGPALLPETDSRQYDLIGFSLPWELEWLGIPAMLNAGGIAIWRVERGEDAPLVMAGGTSVTMNPEPLADIVDAFVIGELEPVAERIANALLTGKGRTGRLDALAALPGLYVPARSQPQAIERLIWDGVAASPRCSLVVTEHAAFPSRFLVEAGRGCPMGCGFCLAGSVYRPVRYAHTGALLEAAGVGLEATSRLGIIGAALSGYPGLEQVVEELVAAGADVSLSSLRADKVTPALLDALKQGGQRTVTIAPEAATEDLRRAIGKPISDEAIATALAAAEEVGIDDVKLYFMTHLPGETPADASAIPAVVRRWAEAFPRLRFAVTLSPFVPKPWTQLENEPFPSVAEVKARLDETVGELRRTTNVDVRPGSARWAAVQAALARGDQGMGRAIAAAAEEGGGYSALKRALKAEGVELDAGQSAPREAPWVRALGAPVACRTAGDDGGTAS